jgi:hypothetical protein
MEIRNHINWRRERNATVAISLTLTQKSLGLILDAIDTRIEAEMARYQITPPSEDVASDFGNDLHLLRMQRHELAALHAEGPGTATLYECWLDQEDNGLALLRAQDVATNRSQGQLSDQATMLYRFVAHTGEEARAIHALRQGWAPYLPMGEALPCPSCGTAFYPQGCGDCWRCGHIG